MPTIPAALWDDPPYDDMPDATGEAVAEVLFGVADLAGVVDATDPWLHGHAAALSVLERLADGRPGVIDRIAFARGLAIVRDPTTLAELVDSGLRNVLRGRELTGDVTAHDRTAIVALS